MTFNEALKQANQHTWWIEGAPGKYQYSYWMYSFVEQRKYYHPDYLSILFCISDNGFAEDVTPSDERLKIYDWIKLQQQKDPSYIYRLHDHGLTLKRRALEAGGEAIAELRNKSKSELLRSLHELKYAAKDFVRWGTFLECIDDYNSFVLPQKMRQQLADKTDDECTTIMVALGAPRIVSFMEHFQRRKAQLILEHRKQLKSAQHFEDIENSGTKGDIIAVVREYSWISVNYGGADQLTEEKLFQQLREEMDQETDAKLKENCSSLDSKVERITTQQVQMCKKHALPKNLELDFEIIRSFGGWMDERKETMVKINEFLFHILQRIAALTQVPKAEIEMYFDSEIDALIQTGKRVDQQTLQLRNGLVVYATQYDGYDGSTMTLFTGEEAKQLAHVLHGERQEQISGIVASKGSHNLSVFEGTVQVVMDVSKEQFINGSVLVTSMTRPEFVPLVKRSSAVITDEGGITCHAAIVSRELGIPCIIGTRQATKQFKNGDHIRMNLETGEVTHL